MIYAFLHRLNKDERLNELLRVTEDDSRIYPLETDNFGPCITYTVSPINGGVVKTERVELKVFETDYDRALCIETRLRELLDLDEGDPGWRYDYVDDNGASRRVEIFTVDQNGGGELSYDFGEQVVYQKILFFIVKWRYIT